MEKIAIIGGGVAGLTAGHYLNSKYNVTLFEKSHRIGGNAYSFTTKDHEEIDIAVAAFGMAGYKEFYHLLDELGVKTDLCVNSYMSFHSLDDGSGLYITPSLKGGRSQKFKMLHPKNIKTLFNMFTGLNKAQALCDDGHFVNKTLREALLKVPQISGETRLVFLCTLCLLSSMSVEDVLNTPATFFLTKLKIHNDVISLKALYSVRCITSGTKTYVDALSRNYKEKIILNSNIKKVIRKDEYCELHMDDGDIHTFDHVIFACNADQALQLIDNPTADETRLLGPWKYNEGRVVVHSDLSAFPQRDLIQAYTFLHTKNGDDFKTSVNGALWHEPQTSKECDYISSQYPNFEIREDLIALDVNLRTPKFDFDSYATMRELPKLNGVNRSYFCGSHFGHGLHSDAIHSAINVARKLDVYIPEVKDPTKKDKVKSIFKMLSKR